MSKKYRTDTSSNETQFKKATTTPLVEDFFGSLFTELSAEEHNRKKSQNNTKKTDKKMENKRREKKSGTKSKNNTDENIKPPRRKQSSANTFTEELSDTEEVVPLPASKLPLKKRVSWENSKQKNLSEKNTIEEKSSDSDTGFKECEVNKQEKATEKQTTETEDPLSDISLLFESIHEEIKRKSDFYTKLKENAVRNVHMKEQLKRTLTAELKNLRDHSIERSITFPGSPFVEPNNNKYVASSLRLRSSGLPIPTPDPTPISTPTPQVKPPGLRRKSTQKSTAESKKVEEPPTTDSPIATSSSQKQSKTEQESGSIMLVDLVSSPSIEDMDMELEENPTESPQEQSKPPSKSKRKSKPSVAENLTSSPTVEENYDTDEDEMQSEEHNKSKRKSKPSVAENLTSSPTVEENYDTDEDEMQSEEHNKSKRTSNRNAESVAASSDVGIEDIPVLEESISQAIKRRPRRKSRLMVSTFDNSFDTDEETTAPAKTPEEPRRSRRSTRKSKNVQWQEYDLSEDESDEEKPSRKSRKSTRKSGPKSSKRSSDSDWTLEITTPTPEDASRRGRKRGRPSVSQSSAKTAKADVEGPPRKRSNRPTSESSRSSFPRAIPKSNLKPGDFVSVYPVGKIGLIRKIWSDNDGKKNYHLQWFIPSDDTLLGDVGERREIFQIDECDDVERAQINGVYDVTRLSLKARYDKKNSQFDRWIEESKQKTNGALFYQKRYEPKFGRFRDVIDIDSDEEELESCPNCHREKEELINEMPIPVGPVRVDGVAEEFHANAVRWRGEEFRVGSSVFLPPGILELQQWTIEKQEEEPYDEAEYPEKYRKKFTRDDDSSLSEPFDIGFISEIRSESKIFSNARDILLRIVKYYRPHNTHLPMADADKKDLNLLYWSAEEITVTLETVQGKCYVAYEKKLDEDASVWSTKGPYRFFFSKKYDKALKKFCPLSEQDLKTFSSSYSDTPNEWPKIRRPLSMMDVFSGCGGLSEGLQQSGVAKCEWAIELDDTAATAFQLNNHHATMYINDCEKQLQVFRDSPPGQPYPRIGEVELLCGGPPCSGLSHLSRHTGSGYSDFEESLIGSFLSYCDYFRPKFVILENVRDFISASKGLVFRLSLSELVKMGYQVTFGVLQCGNYGIPQSRRRVVIMAAAPGEILPSIPEPTHSFLTKLADMNVNGQKIATDVRWSFGPYRAMTVGDAISDLPRIDNDDDRQEMLYGNEPLTHYQQMMRGLHSRGDDILLDHVCKSQNIVNWMRICKVPIMGDWRDIPNIEQNLPDGTIMPKLKYKHRDWKNGEASNGDFRGVCACATKKGATCNKDSKQKDTLIPWCLPHTGNRHAHWAGLFGRLVWKSFFRTVVPDPGPMGKQGRILHPEQNRILSVREYARAQGLPDSFQFSGSIGQKYSQIGNAFAPPLAKSIGYELRKCLAAKSRS